MASLTSARARCSPAHPSVLARDFIPPHARGQDPAARPFILATTAAGLAYLAAVVATKDPFGDLAARRGVLWIFAGLLVAGELLALQVPRADGDGEDALSVGTPFTFALLIVGGAALCIVVQAVAAVAGGIVHRRPLWRIPFDVAQYALALGTAGAILTVGRLPAAGTYNLQADALPDLVLAASVFFIVKNTITGVALALADGEPILPFLRRDVVWQVSTTGIFLALAPVLVVLGDEHSWYVGLALAPMVAVYRSVTAAQQRDRQALHDLLTGLPNRALAVRRAEQALARGAEGLAVVLVDLDRFREVNDTLGYASGDEVLREAARRVVAAGPAEAVVARFGADQFALLVPDCDALRSRRVAVAVRAALERTYAVADLTVDLEASAGSAVLPDDSPTVEAVLQKAELALEAAKDRRSGVEAYRPSIDHQSRGRLSLLGELRRALEAGSDELILHFQPKADVVTGRIVGAEALVRWNHPERGLVPPGDFVPLAEATGLIRPFTLHVLEMAIRQLADWRAEGLELSVAVNLSTRNLYDLDLPQRVRGLLETWGVPPSALVLEITESAIMDDPARALEVLRILHGMGLQLSIDDFGTGYSSLAYLKRLPVSELKIDRSFVSTMDCDSDDALIVQSTIELGRKFGLRVVAEGVETEGVLAELREQGCDVAQGWLVGRPVAAAELTRLLHDNRSSASPALP